MEKIIELLYRFYDKQIDTDFMYEFIDIVTEYKDLETYINNIDFSKNSNSEDYVASYEKMKFGLYVPKDEINKHIKKLTLFD